ncbi:MAG: hypothetical protein CMM44_00545 [Rhodospirillaceae bacterium]|nr:hypothetical protein [Rhodospirillaceae bacterium]
MVPFELVILNNLPQKNSAITNLTISPTAYIIKLLICFSENSLTMGGGDYLAVLLASSISFAKFIPFPA